MNSSYIDKINKLENDLFEKTKEIENLKQKIKKVVYSPNPNLNIAVINPNSSINISELQVDLRNKNDNVHYTTFSGKESEIIQDNYETISNIQSCIQLPLDGEKANVGNNNNQQGHVTNISQISFTNSIDSPIFKKIVPLNNNNNELNLDLLSCPGDITVTRNPSTSTNLHLKSGLNGTIQILNKSFSKIIGSFKGEESKSSALSETTSSNLDNSKNYVKRTKTKEFLLTGSLDISRTEKVVKGEDTGRTISTSSKKFLATPKTSQSMTKTKSTLNNHIRSISVTTPKNNTNVTNKIKQSVVESEDKGSDKNNSQLQLNNKSIVSINLSNNSNNNLSRSVNSVKSVNSNKSNFSEKSNNSLRNSGIRKSTSITMGKSPTPTQTITLNQCNQSVQFSNDGSEKKIKTTDKILDKYHKILDQYNKNAGSGAQPEQSQNIRQISKKKMQVQKSEKSDIKNNLSQSTPGVNISSRIKKVITGSLVSGNGTSPILK
jgi:hypothetical protein